MSRLPAPIARLAPSRLRGHRHAHQVTPIDAEPILASLIERTDSHELHWAPIIMSRSSWVVRVDGAEVCIVHGHMYIRSVVDGAQVPTTHCPALVRQLRDVIRERHQERCRRMGEWLLSATAAGAITWRRHTDTDWEVEGQGAPGHILLGTEVWSWVLRMASDPVHGYEHRLVGGPARDIRRLIRRQERERSRQQQRASIIKVDRSIPSEQRLIDQGEREAALVEALAARQAP